MRALLRQLEEGARRLRLRNGVSIEKSGASMDIYQGDRFVGRATFRRWQSPSGPQTHGVFTAADGQATEMNWAYFDDVKRWAEQTFGRAVEEGARENAHRTAIARRKPSAPVLWLERNGLLKGRILDYGAGHGGDADYLGATKYDPHFWPERPEGRFDTVICNYVLNVVEPGDEAGILADIRGYLAPGGHAYLAVRRDVAREGFTKSGSFQRTVVLDLPLLAEVPGKYAIYQLA